MLLGFEIGWLAIQVGCLLLAHLGSRDVRFDGGYQGVSSRRADIGEMTRLTQLRMFMLQTARHFPRTARALLHTSSHRANPATTIWRRLYGG